MAAIGADLVDAQWWDLTTRARHRDVRERDWKPGRRWKPQHRANSIRTPLEPPRARPATGPRARWEPRMLEQTAVSSWDTHPLWARP